jgi:4-hydroxy-tetrahydrodipicolinate reductase
LTNICFAGITGWTAPPILAAIDAAADLHLVAGVSRSAAGQSLADTTGVEASGQVYATVAEALDATHVDVLVDYTSATAVMANCLTAIDKGVHVVIGSSGLDAGDHADIDARAQAAGVGVIAAGNFSVMAAILRRAATMAAEHLEHWEILDYGSDEKPDVPSGTSRELAETLAEVRTPTIRVPVTDLHGPTEARGASVAGTQVHSLRLPGFVVSTEIVFASTGERLVMRHDPGLTPDPYVDGTLLAIRKVADAPGLRRGLDALLFNS